MGSKTLPSWNIYLDYRKLVDNISTRLQRENAIRLANLYSLPKWYFEVGPNQDPTYALTVLIAMEGKGVFSPDNLKGLIEAMKNVQREDLCNIVKDFIKEKYEQGVTQECVRRQTNPQESDSHTRTRPSSIIVYQGSTSVLNFPNLRHSTSLGSITIDTHDSHDDEETDGLKTRSRPDLTVHSREDVNAVSGLPGQSSSSTLHSSLASFKLALLSADCLMNQIGLLLGAITASTLLEQPTPEKESDQELLELSFMSANTIVQKLQQLCKDELVNPRLSHASSYATCLSQSPSSFCIEGNMVDNKDIKANSYRNSAAVSKNSNQHKVLLAPPPDTVHPIPQQTSQSTPFRRSRPLLTSSAVNPQINTTQSSAIPPLPQFKTRSRHRSRKEDKKINKHGILIWNVKVKKLKGYLNQPDRKLESEEFYDSVKRPLRASLVPHGLGEDCGSHMTLMIHCLEEPKSSSIPNLEIVVNVIDPHSDSEVPMVRPIRRSLERRGIRIVQQFLSHSIVDTFQSSYITVSIAILDRQVESEDSDMDV